MNPLAEKIRKARQTQVVAGGFTFIIRRPTDLEMLEMRGIKVKQRDVMDQFVIGWEGIKESDLVPGGTGELVPFDHELFSEWVADHPELWTQLTTAVVDSYKAHEAELEASAKN